VEDELLLRISAVEMVAERGLPSGRAGRRGNRLEARPDIYIVFIQMPGSMDSLKLARFVRDRWRTRDLSRCPVRSRCCRNVS